jgi:hypothetical protein
MEEVRVAAKPSISYGGTSSGRPVEKENVLISPAYETAVRRLPCVRCGIVGFTQFCHTDEGKGLSIKTDVRRGWAGCGPRGGIPGCHWIVGTSGTIARPARRLLEAGYAAWTRAQVIARGWWPARLPLWIEQPKGATA